MRDLYIGIDNGVTGKIGVVKSDGTGEIYKLPVKSEQSYTKKKQNITRVQNEVFHEWLCDLRLSCENAFVLIERPMVNPTRFKATVSALRCLESVLIAVERTGLPFAYIDSKQWQKDLLPSGLKGSDENKKAAVDVARRLFPSVDCGKDADGLLIAEWGRKKGW